MIHFNKFKTIVYKDFTILHWHHRLRRISEPKQNVTTHNVIDVNKYLMPTSLFTIHKLLSNQNEIENGIEGCNFE